MLLAPTTTASPAEVLPQCKRRPPSASTTRRSCRRSKTTRSSCSIRPAHRHLECRRAEAQGLRGRRDHRPAFLALLYRPRRGARLARTRAATGARAAGRFEDEGWRVRKDGTRFWANVVITALRDDAGKLTGFAQDHARPDASGKRRRKRLRQSEERFRLLVDSVKDYAIFMLDPDGLVASWNAGAQRIKGYAARRDHRPALLGVLPPGGQRGRQAARATRASRARSAASRTKAGACARTARASGPTSSSRPSTTTTDACAASPRSRAT